MSVYYNENDRYCAEWLRNLAGSGLIASGTIDERSIVDISPNDLDGITEFHAFAGIGGWPYALQLAGWPDDRSVWTGSCPCQPFSSAGKQGGAADERHLWPQWFRLIRECRPDIIFGEQVAGAVGFGWLDRVFADLEAAGYACGASVLGAHSVGAPHIRQRLFWVADTQEHQWDERHSLFRGGDTGSEAAVSEQLARSDGATGGMADACRAGLEGRRRYSAEQVGLQGDVSRPDGGSFWSDVIWLPCLDGKARRVEPSIQPLAHGVSARVGRLRAYGNAIVPQVAAEFIRAALHC